MSTHAKLVNHCDQDSLGDIEDIVGRFQRASDSSRVFCACGNVHKSSLTVCKPNASAYRFGRSIDPRQFQAVSFENCRCLYKVQSIPRFCCLSYQQK